MKEILHLPFDYGEKIESYLQGLTCSYLMDEIDNDPEVQLLLTDICTAVFEVLSKYNPIKNAPDGIHEVLFSNIGDFQNYYGNQAYYKYLINDFLVKNNVAEILNYDKAHFYNKAHFYDGEMISEGAMQKPYTMIQVANSLLPPVILSKKKLSKEAQCKNNSDNVVDLFPPNSFYTHAHVKDSSIIFILNKVIEESSFTGISKKSTFTVKEKEVHMMSIVDSICDHLLDHVQMLDFDGEEYTLLQKCHQHSLKDGLSLECYGYFRNKLAQSIKTRVVFLSKRFFQSTHVNAHDRYILRICLLKTK